MRLDSCRELKHAWRRRGGQTPWLGLGVSRTADGRHVLAVRVRDLSEARELLGAVARAARDEVDVRAVGELRAFTSGFRPEELQRRRRPLVPGCSIGHGDVTAGTLGAAVLVDGAPHLLSNSHVLADSGRGALGDPVLQPGGADGGGPSDRVASLATFAPLHPQRPNLIDAALARPDPGQTVDRSRYPGGPVEDVIAEPDAGDAQVEKLGRTTGHTAGRVTAFEVDGLRIRFPHGELEFDDQIEIGGDDGNFSAGGDSGSLIWTSAERRGLGLLFAGSRFGAPGGGGFTYANPLSAVLEHFDARLAPADE